VRSRLCAFAYALVLCASMVAPAWAQDAVAPAATNSPAASPATSPAMTGIHGVVSDDSGKPVAGARVEVHGPANVTATTDASGAYDLQIPPGMYRVVVSKPGYEIATQTSLSITGAGIVGNVSLVTKTTPLQEIGRVGAAGSAVERSQFNTTPAATQTLTTQDFEDQGRGDNLGKMLDEIPGVSTVTAASSYYSGIGMASSGWLNPQIRGSFSYETAESYDGFPLLSGDPQSGFNAGLMTTVGLGGIDIIKGPGADSTTINGAVGGTINYRSLNPTVAPKLSVDVGTDGLGGSAWKATYTGSVLNGRLGYAVGYSSTNGPGQFSAHGGSAGNWVQGGNYNDVWALTINGQQYLYPGCSGTVTANGTSSACMGNTTTVHTNPTLYQYNTPWVMCCRSPLSGTDEWSEYGKIVYHVTPEDSQSNITADLLYSGTSYKMENGGYRGPTLFGGNFAPYAAGNYNGSLPGNIAPGAINAAWYSVDDAFANRWQQTVETNIRGQLGPGYFHLGYMSLYQMNDWYVNSPTSGISTQVWGTIPLIPFVNGLPPSYPSTVVNTAGTAPNALCSNLPGCTLMTFNGQSAKFEEYSIYENDEYQHNHDWVADYRLPIGGMNSISASFTQSVVQPEQGTANAIDGIWAEAALQEPAEHYNLLKQTNNEFRLSASVASGKLTSLTSLYYNQYDNYLSAQGLGPTETAVSLAAQGNPATSSTPPGALWNWVTYAPGVVAAFPTAQAIQNYANSFTNNYNYYMAPRQGFSYLLNDNTSLRFSAGGAIVPLPILALAAVSGAALPTYNMADNFYTQAIAPANLKPETSWGYDLGADVRVPKANITMKADVYLTDLQNQFFTHQQVVGSYSGVDSTGNSYGEAPLVDTSLQNLGHSRYEGVELAVRRDVSQGFGFIAQGYLERAYAYDIPSSFYNLPGQVCTSTGTGCQNLGIVPNQNFNDGGTTGAPSGTIGPDFSIAPYSGGYGEISYHWGKHNSFARFGATYYGNYNTFHEPAFFLLNASIHYGMGPHFALQLSADNIGNIYTSPYTGGYAAQVPAVSGVPAPEANGQYAFAPYLSVGPSVIEFALQYR
jgi:Carboxypeptidase regulatory-like domain/TonB dependent receptor/TonB-dependent Receptor Plug Domain